MENMRKELEKIPTKEIIQLLKDDCSLFYLPYCTDTKTKEITYNFRIAILEILKERFDKQMYM